MNIFSRLYAAFRLARDLQSVRVVNGAYSLTGEYIDADTALKQATVWACLSYLSRTVAQLPWRVLRPGPNGSHVEELRSPAHRLLRTRPNPEMGPYAFKELMVWRAASRGNAVATIEWNNRNEPIALWPQHPDRVEYTRDITTEELRYEIRLDDGSVQVFSPRDVLHVRGFGEGAVGLDVMTYAAESIGWARATETFGAKWFKQGLSPTGVLSMKRPLTSAGKDVLQEELEARFGGAKSAHRTLIIDSEASYTRISADPAAAQLLETRQHQVEDICRWFGVPPHKVMHLLRATFSNIEHQSIEVVVDSITPWCIRLEEEADFKLLGRNPAGFFTKLDVKGLLRGDYASRQAGLQIMRRNGVITADQWAALEDMPPPGPANGGNLYIVEGNMTLLKKVGEEPKPVAAPSAPSDPANPKDPVDDREGDAPDASHVARARRQLAHINSRSIH